MSAPAPRPVWQKTLLLALAYFGAACLSRLLAIPPGYATVVWPPAGLALGALWLWGLELWPGVLLGSFAANAWSPAGSSVPAPLALAAWIAVGAAAQAAAAAALARRALGGRDPLRDEKDLFRFLMLAGPLASLISASWSVAGMRALGAISPREAPFAWATWWIGDSIGAALAAPILLLWFGRGSAGLRRGRAAVSWTLAATMLAVAGVHLYAVRNEGDIQRSHARQKLADISLTLRVGLAGHLDALQTSADIFTSEDTLTRAEFRRFARGILARHPGMQALEWRPRVTYAQRRGVEETARREGLKGYSFTGIAPGGGLEKRGPAPEYFPILYAEPLRGNETVLGLDIGQQQGAARDAAEKALAENQPAASAGVRLVQETGSQTGILVMVPVRSTQKGGPVGLIEGVYRVGDMMESLLAGVDARALGLSLYDDTPPGPPQLLYSRGDPASPPVEPLSINGDFAGRRWRVELRPHASFQARERSVLSWFVAISALLFSYLVAWVTLTLFGRAERVNALVEQKTAELREQERRLMRAQKMESVGRLAGGIAHEFNNILMGASGLAQIVLQALGPKHPSATDLEGIVVSIKRAGHLVSQLLTFSRRKESNLKATDLNGLVAQSSKLIAAAVGRRIELDVSVASAPAWILADAGQVEQVLLNLCFNARDALTGKGKISLATRPVLLERGLDTPHLPAKPGRYVLLEVRDDGAGIPPEVLPRIFEPFFTTKPFGEGTGLGMSVVLGIVRQHGGGLDIKTAPGQGAAIRVYWPETEAPPPEKTPARAADAPRGEGTILIVDDEPQMRSVLERILAGYGYSPVSADSGEAALELLARRPEIRGVVLDLVMPGMDGLETHDRMKARRPDLKILFLSGYAPREFESEVARRGLAFLAKPADPAQLALALHELLADPPRA